MGTKGSIFSPSDYGSEQQLINVSVAEKAAPEEASKKKSGRGEHANPDELHKAEWVRDQGERPVDRVVQLRLRRHVDRSDAPGQRLHAAWQADRV